jgi:hypothetical protein
MKRMKANKLTKVERAQVAQAQVEWQAREDWNPADRPQDWRELAHLARASRPIVTAASLNLGAAPRPPAPPARTEIAVARVINSAATAPYSRSAIPRPGLKSGWNMEDSPAPLRAEAATGMEVSAASRARMARLATLAQGSRGKAPFAPAPCAPAAVDESIKKIPMSFAPPRFKVQKNGKTVEEKWVMRLRIRTVFFTAAGGVIKEWKASSRISKDKATGEDSVTPPASASGVSWPTLEADFKCRWGAARAAELIHFLAGRD